MLSRLSQTVKGEIVNLKPELNTEILTGHLHKSASAVLVSRLIF